MVELKTEKTLSDKLSEAILYICQNNLKAQSNFTVEGVLCVRLEGNEVILVNVNEKYWANCYNSSSETNGILENVTDSSEISTLPKLHNDFSKFNGCVKNVHNLKSPPNVSYEYHCKLSSNNLNNDASQFAYEHCIESDDNLSKTAHCTGSMNTVQAVQTLVEDPLTQTVHCVEEKPFTQSAQCVGEEPISQTLIYFGSEDAYENTTIATMDEEPVENSVLNMCNSSFDSVQSIIEIPLINGKPLNQIKEVENESQMDDRVTGMWVQCSNEECLTWRFVPHPAGMATVPYDPGSELIYEQEPMNIDSEITTLSSENMQPISSDIADKTSFTEQNYSGSTEDMSPSPVKKRITRRSSAGLSNSTSAKKSKTNDKFKITMYGSISKNSVLTQTDAMHHSKKSIAVQKDSDFYNDDKQVNTISNEVQEMNISDGKKKEFQEKVLQQLKDILKNQQSEISMLSEISKHKFDSDSHGKKILSSPIESKQDLSKLCNHLSDQNFRLDLLNFFASLKCENISKSIQAIMAALGTTCLWKDYCLSGTYDRISFETLPVYSVIVDAIKKSHIDVNFNEMNSALDSIFSWTSISKSPEIQNVPKPVSDYTSGLIKSIFKDSGPHQQQRRTSLTQDSGSHQKQHRSSSTPDSGSHQKQHRTSLTPDPILPKEGKKSSKTLEHRFRKRCCNCSTTKSKKWFGSLCIKCHYAMLAHKKKVRKFKRLESRRRSPCADLTDESNMPVKNTKKMKKRKRLEYSRLLSDAITDENNMPVRNAKEAAFNVQSPKHKDVFPIFKKIKLTPLKESDQISLFNEDRMFTINDSINSPQSSASFSKCLSPSDRSNLLKEIKQTLVVKLERIDECCPDLIMNSQK